MSKDIEVLIEIDGWVLWRTLQYGRKELGYWYVIKHRHSGDGLYGAQRRSAVYSRVVKGTPLGYRCTHCEERVPEAMIGFRSLLEWER